MVQTQVVLVLSMTKLMFNKLISLKLTLMATFTQNCIYHLAKTHDKMKKCSVEVPYILKRGRPQTSTVIGGK